MIEIEILWDDLSPEKQRDIADQLQMDVADVPNQTNWDVFPIASVELEDDYADS